MVNKMFLMGVSEVRLPVGSKVNIMVNKILLIGVAEVRRACRQQIVNIIVK